MRQLKMDREVQLQVKCKNRAKSKSKTKIASSLNHLVLVKMNWRVGPSLLYSPGLHNISKRELMTSVNRENTWKLDKIILESTSTINSSISNWADTNKWWDSFNSLDLGKLSTIFVQLSVLCVILTLRKSKTKLGNKLKQINT